MNEFLKCATFCWGWSGTKDFGFEFRNEFEEVRKQSETQGRFNKPIFSFLQVRYLHQICLNESTNSVKCALLVL